MLGGAGALEIGGGSEDVPGRVRESALDERRVRQRPAVASDADVEAFFDEVDVLVGRELDESQLGMTAQELDESGALSERAMPTEQVMRRVPLGSAIWRATMLSAASASISIARAC